MNRDDMPIAMCYVPWQKWQDVLEPEDSLEHGTIFTELALPFYGAAAACNPNFNKRRRGGGYR